MENQPLPDKCGLVGFLIPNNDIAVDAMKAAARERMPHHSSLLHNAKDEDDNVVPSFIISMDRRPLYSDPANWVIGTGVVARRSWGVDFLLTGAPNVEPQHASFGWAREAGGFYLYGTTNGNGKLALRIDGKTVGRSQRHLLTYTNTIDIGGCQFRWQFDDKTPEEEGQFKRRLEGYSREHLDNSDPMIDRTPSSDRPEEWFGKFFVNEEIRKSVNGVEKRVTHSTRAAVYIIRVITQSIENKAEYDRELKVARKVERMEHIRIAFIRGVKEELIERKFVWTQAPDTILRKAWWILPYFPQNLRAYIPQGEDGPTCDVTESTAQILEGVAYLHSHDIVHRDLRPENIAVADTRPLQLKIINFAAADAERHFYEATSYMNLDHINHYAAPELRLCGYGQRYMTTNGGHTGAVDVWSCGVILMEMLRFMPACTFFNTTEQQVLINTIHTLLDAGNQMHNLARDLFVWDWKDRPTALGALGHYFQARPSLEHKGKKRAAADVSNDEPLDELLRAMDKSTGRKLRRGTSTGRGLDSGIGTSGSSSVRQPPLDAEGDAPSNDEGDGDASGVRAAR